MSEPHFTTTALRVEIKKLLDRWIGIPAQFLVHVLCTLLSPLFPPVAVSKVHRILLVKLWGVGNLAMIFPYVRALRAHFPDAELEFLTLKRNDSMVNAADGISRVHCIRDRGLVAPFVDVLRVILALRRRPVDLFLDFEQFLRLPGLIARLSGARQSIGFDTPGQHRARLHTARVPYDGTRHMSLVFGDIVRAAGVPISELGPLHVPRPRWAEEQADRILRSPLERPWILLHAGSGDNFPGRRWPVPRFAEAALELTQRFGGTLFLSGTSEERTTVDELEQILLERLLEKSSKSVLNLCGRLDLPTLVAMLARMDLVISNDTGPVHLAGALGVSVLGLYGPNTPELYGPLGPNSRAIYHRLPCSPCLTNENGKTSSCRYPACILSITVEEVVDAARELLERRRAGAALRIVGVAK